MRKSSKTQSKPWEVITWSPEHQQNIYRDWGINYTFKQQYETASKYYTKSLNIKSDDIRAFLNRSLCKDDIAQCTGAFDDAVAAFVLDNCNHPVNLQVCDALYHLNQLEQNKLELASKARQFVWEPNYYHGVRTKPGKFIGHRESSFLRRLDVVEQNFLDTLGENIGIFLKKHKSKLEEIVDKVKRQKAKDPRPMWKVLRDDGICDIVSILLEQTKELHIREQARLDQYYRLFLQVYFLKGWIDVSFLKNLITDERLLLPQTRRSTPILSEFIKSQYDTVYRFLKMLQARSPLYTKRYKMCPDQKLAAKIRQDHLYRVQYQTRRDMFSILDNVKKLRAEGKLHKLSSYIEQAMGNYVQRKSLRVLPRKFEFMNEIYNVLALAYADRLVVPSDLLINAAEDRLLVLMSLSQEKGKHTDVKYVFGDKSTYQEPDAPDYAYMAYKKRISKLEKRLHYAKYSIEKCYLFHELAKNHMTQSKYDEARALGKKMLEEAESCKNYLWKFLGVLAVCKANVMQHKLEQTKLSLELATEVATKLKSPRITYFVNTCIRVNQICMQIKKSHSEELLFSSLKRERMRLSMIDLGSISSGSEIDLAN